MGSTVTIATSNVEFIMKAEVQKGQLEDRKWTPQPSARTQDMRRDTQAVLGLSLCIKVSILCKNQHNGSKDTGTKR